MKNFFTKYGIFIGISLAIALFLLILFVPFESIESEIKYKKEIGQELVDQNLITVQLSGWEPLSNVGYWTNRATSGYENIIQIPISLKVENKSDYEISLVRGTTKMLFRNFKGSENKVLTYELGYPIKPHKSRVCETYIQFKYASEELDTIIQEIDEREFLLGKITEVWASEASFNPFSEIISFFRKRQNTE